MIICDDAIVYDSDALLVVKVRMSIDVSLVTVGGPPRVPNPNLMVVSWHALD